MNTNKYIVLIIALGLIAFFHRNAFIVSNEAIVIQSLTDEDQDEHAALIKVTDDINTFIDELPTRLDMIVKNTESNIDAAYEQAKDAINNALVTPPTTESYFALYDNLQNTFANTIQGFENDAELAVQQEIVDVDELKDTLQDIPLTADKIVIPLSNKTIRIGKAYEDSLNTALQDAAQHIMDESHLAELALAGSRDNLRLKEIQYNVTSPREAWDLFSSKVSYIAGQAWDNIAANTIKTAHELASETKDRLIDEYTRAAKDSIEDAVKEWLNNIGKPSEGGGGGNEPGDEKWPFQLKNNTKEILYIYYAGTQSQNILTSEQLIQPATSFLLSQSQLPNYKKEQTIIIFQFLGKYIPCVFSLGKTMFIDASKIVSVGDTNDVLVIKPTNSKQASFNYTTWGYPTLQAALTAAKDLAKNSSPAQSKPIYNFQIKDTDSSDKMLDIYYIGDKTKNLSPSKEVKRLYTNLSLSLKLPYQDTEDTTLIISQFFTQTEKPKKFTIYRFTKGHPIYIEVSEKKNADSGLALTPVTNPQVAAQDGGKVTLTNNVTIQDITSKSYANLQVLCTNNPQYIDSDFYFGVMDGSIN
jgi:hypothetical protein